MLDWRITSHHPSDMLGTSIRYCSADLYNTYTMYHPPDVRWHVLNDTMSQYYLRYYRIFGLNGVLVMQIRDCNASATYQSLMDHIFSDYIGVFMDVYLDDIVIYSDTPEEHFRHVKLVIDRLRDNKFFLSSHK